MNKFENAILVLSHPDDECLFASSILESISILVICFGNIPGEKNISLARKESLSTYPLMNFKLINLDITQSKQSFLPLNWFNIKEKYTGLIGGYHKESYDRNYSIILQKIREIIPENSTIITHNPWGEYGHSHHCQVFKASFELAIEKKSELYVDGYYSNLSKFYTKKKLYLLEPDIYPLKTNLEIYSVLKNHYTKLGCWTWYNDYKLPRLECFYKINLNLNKSSLSKDMKCFDLPLVFIDHIDPLKYYLFAILKKFIPKFLKILIRNRINNFN